MRSFVLMPITPFALDLPRQRPLPLVPGVQLLDPQKLPPPLRLDPPLLERQRARPQVPLRDPVDPLRLQGAVVNPLQHPLPLEPGADRPD